MKGILQFNLCANGTCLCLQQFSPALTGRPELYVKSNRSSHSSDTSSAYSGSDTMASVQSSLDADEVDLSGLIESIVDSDEEEDLAESMDVSDSSLSHMI